MESIGIAVDLGAKPVLDLASEVEINDGDGLVHVCAWCPESERPPILAGQLVSHGMCDSCVKKSLAEYAECADLLDADLAVEQVAQGAARREILG